MYHKLIKKLLGRKKHTGVSCTSKNCIQDEKAQNKLTLVKNNNNIKGLVDIKQEDEQ